MTTNNSSLTSMFLTAGIVTGPLFIVVALLQAFTRKGFNIVRHPASMLSLGDSGWIQITNFVLTGILLILCGIGLRRALTTGIGRNWTPRLFVICGIAFVIGGLFTPDPGLGFPPGTPEGVAKEMSWHGTIHAFAPVFGFVSQTVALIILGRRFGAQGQLGWKISTFVAAATMFVLATIPNITADWEKGIFNFLPLWAGTILGFGWTSLVIAKVRDSG